MTSIDISCVLNYMKKSQLSKYLKYKSLYFSLFCWLQLPFPNIEIILQLMLFLHTRFFFPCPSLKLLHYVNLLLFVHLMKTCFDAENLFIMFFHPFNSVHFLLQFSLPFQDQTLTFFTQVLSEIIQHLFFLLQKLLTCMKLKIPLRKFWSTCLLS